MVLDLWKSCAEAEGMAENVLVARARTLLGEAAHPMYSVAANGDRRQSRM
jgi:hypothetical protein